MIALNFVGISMVEEDAMVASIGLVSVNVRFGYFIDSSWTVVC